MAPALLDTPRATPPSEASVGPKELFIGGPQEFNKLAEEHGTGRQPPAAHPEYLPVWDADTKYVPAALRHAARFHLLILCHRYPPLQPFTHYEHGKDADPRFSLLFRDAISVTELTPSTGSEIRGVQLSALTDQGKDQLALLTAQRKVVGNFDTHSRSPQSLTPILQSFATKTLPIFPFVKH